MLLLQQYLLLPMVLLHHLLLQLLRLAGQPREDGTGLVPEHQFDVGQALRPLLVAAWVQRVKGERNPMGWGTALDRRWARSSLLPGCREVKGERNPMGWGTSLERRWALSSSQPAEVSTKAGHGAKMGGVLPHNEEGRGANTIVPNSASWCPIMGADGPVRN